MFKYNLDQIIYYMADNRVHSAPVLSRMYVDNLHPDWTSTPEQRDLFTAFGATNIMYATCHGTISETLAFASAQDLVNSLLKECQDPQS
jgi:hypothetical protein